MSFKLLSPLKFVGRNLIKIPFKIATWLATQVCFGLCFSIVFFIFAQRIQNTTLAHLKEVEKKVTWKIKRFTDEFPFPFPGGP